MSLTYLHHARRSKSCTVCMKIYEQKVPPFESMTASKNPGPIALLLLHVIYYCGSLIASRGGGQRGCTLLTQNQAGTIDTLKNTLGEPHLVMQYCSRKSSGGSSLLHSTKGTPTATTPPAPSGCTPPAALVSPAATAAAAVVLLL
jgi:hypothetical protein